MEHLSSSHLSDPPGVRGCSLGLQVIGAQDHRSPVHWNQIYMVSAHMFGIPSPVYIFSQFVIPAKCGRLTVNIRIIYFSLGVVHVLQLCLISLEFDLLPFSTAPVPVSFREGCVASGDQFSCKAPFGMNKVSLLTNGLILNKSLTLCFYIYKRRLIIGVGVWFLDGNTYLVVSK